jgi:hypothetical protein
MAEIGKAAPPVGIGDKQTSIRLFQDMKHLLAEIGCILSSFIMSVVSIVMALALQKPNYFVYDESDEIIHYSVLDSLRASPISIVTGIAALFFMAFGFLGLYLRWFSIKRNR